MSVESLEALKTKVIASGMNIIYALVILFIGLKLVGYADKLILKSRLFTKMDQTLKSFLTALINMVFKLLLMISILAVLGIPTASFVAVIGAAGLAVGLALQGSLSNIAGGVLIIALRTFRVGDYISGAGQEGTVEKIGIFYTNLVTIDNKSIIVPNSDLANGSITNYTIFPKRRLDMVFGVGYDSDIKKVKATIMKVIDSNALIIREPAPFVRLSNHGGSSLDFKVRVWVKTEDYWELNYTLLEEVKEAFDAAGIEIPYPQMVIHTEKEEA
jgi:small conductance mechanosensitive channel